jgi:hypothetical protein
MREIRASRSRERATNLALRGMERGRCGEYLVFCELLQLPRPYALLTNVLVPCRPGVVREIDVLIVRPGSPLVALESKHQRGFLHDGPTGNSWGCAADETSESRPWHRPDPFEQSYMAADALVRWLDRLGSTDVVHPLVVFSEPDCQVSVQGPKRTDHVMLSGLRSYLRRLEGTTTPSPEAIQAIRALAYTRIAIGSGLEGRASTECARVTRESSTWCASGSRPAEVMHPRAAAG